MKHKKKTLILLILIFPILFVVAANYSIENNAQNKTYEDAAAIPKNSIMNEPSI